VETFIIKRGDTAPSLQATLKDSTDGVEVVVDLTGKTVSFVMRKLLVVNGVETDGEIVVDNAAASIPDPANGVVRYDWVVGDTDDEGTFRGEFKVVSNGRPSTYPSKSYIPILIGHSLD
jgi:hypothetical protein